MTAKQSPKTDVRALLEVWEAGMRPARIQAVRDDLMAATGLYVPHSLSAIEGVWFDHYKGQVTRALREAAESEQSSNMPILSIEDPKRSP